MPTLKTCPKTGNYIYRKAIPMALRPLVGRGSEWKVSLGTKSLAEARVLFTAEAARCEEALAAAHAALKGESTLLPSDAPKLADRWVAAELAAWNQDPDRFAVFLAQVGVKVALPLDVIDEDCPRLQGLLTEAILQALTAAHQPLPPSTSMLYRALRREFFIAWRTLCETALQRHQGDWKSAPRPPGSPAPTVEGASLLQGPTPLRSGVQVCRIEATGQRRPRRHFKDHCRIHRLHAATHPGRR